MIKVLEDQEHKERYIFHITNQLVSFVLLHTSGKYKKWKRTRVKNRKEAFCFYIKKKPSNVLAFSSNRNHDQFYLTE